MLLNSQQIQDIIKISEHSNLAQVGIDLSVKEIYRINNIYNGSILKNKTILPKEKFVLINPRLWVVDGEKDKIYGWFLKPGTYALHFNEQITLPVDKTAFVLHRSSVYRQGNIIMSPVWDPGFTTGENVMATTLIVNNPMIVEQNARLAQVIVHENHSTTEYNGQWQGKAQV